MWRIAFKLFNNDIMKLFCVAQQNSRGLVSRWKNFSLHHFAQAPLHRVSFSVYTSRCDSNLNLTLMSDACWRYFSCNTSFTTYRIAVITINVHIIFLCYIMIKIYNNYFLTFFIIFSFLGDAIKHLSYVFSNCLM